jgi:hypothetical protein
MAYLYLFELTEESGLFLGVQQLLGGCHCETYYYRWIQSTWKYLEDRWDGGNREKLGMEGRQRDV